MDPEEFIKFMEEELEIPLYNYQKDIIRGKQPKDVLSEDFWDRINKKYRTWGKTFTKIGQAIMHSWRDGKNVLFFSDSLQHSKIACQRTQMFLENARIVPELIRDRYILFKESQAEIFFTVPESITGKGKEDVVRINDLDFHPVVRRRSLIQPVPDPPYSSKEATRLRKESLR